MAKTSAITLVYFGGDADQHRLDLYDASASYYGLARTLAIVGHYYIKQEIIAHAPRSAMDLYIVPPEEGSFKQTILTAVVGGIVGAPFGVFATRVIDSWIPPTNPEMQQVIQLLKEQNELMRARNGLPKVMTPKEEKEDAEITDFMVKHNKDLQAVRSITSNSFKSIYRPVGRSAEEVGIIAGRGRPPRAVVNSESLTRIEADEVDKKDVIFLCVVNSFSRTSKVGIVFSRDFDASIRIEYTKKGRLKGQDEFSWSQYHRRPIRVHGRFVRFFDGNIKKFLVFTVERVTDQEEIDEYFSDEHEVRPLK